MPKPIVQSKASSGKIIIISAPSGCGKTTLCKKLASDRIGLVHSVSMTTRPPRVGEKEGVDYRFVSKERFLRLADGGGFLEYERNFGYYYGTPKSYVEKNLKAGRSVLLSIDVKGAMKIRRAYPCKSVLIFILPPSVRALKNRLCLRKSDGLEAICARLSLAKKEMSYKGRYDYRVVNDRLDSAYIKLKKIILKEMNGQ